MIIDKNKIEELGNNKFMIEDEIVYAPNLNIAIERAKKAIIRMIEKQSIPLSPEEEYALKEAYAYEMSCDDWVITEPKQTGMKNEVERT